MKREDINIRDPFVLPHMGRYYLYGTRGAACQGSACGFDVYVSGDLEQWDGPHEIFHAPQGFWADRDFWAPEVHRYHGGFYLFASFKSGSACRGTQILHSDSPIGPFQPHSDGPVTPRGWECLDGTLYIDGQDNPTIVFCHEWVQAKNGEICALRLSTDLAHAVGDPEVLFHASDPKWADKGADDYITDGPFLYRAKNGELLMIWSSLVHAGQYGNYVQAVSRSVSGEINGKWIHDGELLFQKDGGHGMLFQTFGGKTMLTLHRPNKAHEERPHFFEIAEHNGKISTK
jgi:arabinan endo-1,5-alpha-L-arabinosidase